LAQDLLRARADAAAARGRGTAPLEGTITGLAEGPHRDANAASTIRGGVAAPAGALHAERARAAGGPEGSGADVDSGSTAGERTNRRGDQEGDEGGEVAGRHARALARRVPDENDEENQRSRMGFRRWLPPGCRLEPGRVTSPDRVNRA